MTQRQFLIAAAVIVLAAFGVREWFVLTMTVPEPNQGDVGAYLRYALHLAWDGTFSQAGNGEAATPDAFRSPGYPWLLWALLPDANWADGRWFWRAYQAQALLGAATVAGVIALAHQWMPRGFALAAGVWMALQTHHIAATGALLTEALFGALLVGGLLAASYKRGWAAGVLFGLAYLTNPVVAFLPFLLAPMLWKDARKPALVMVAVVCVAIGGWYLRNTIQHADGGRAGMNFVQGAWPEYHELFKRPWQYPAKKAAMDREVEVIGKDTGEGVRMVLNRLASHPQRTVNWYAGKPYLLWDWEIRVGHGMAYTVTMRDTILDTGPLLGATTIQWVLNPLLFALAFCGIVLGLVRGGPERMVAVAVLYLTAVHFVLQAEPRYAIPYRSLEILLAFGALAYLRAMIPSRSRQPSEAAALSLA